MKDFAELGISAKRRFTGNKIYIETILDKALIIEFFEVRPSKKNDNTDCLYMQIKLDGVEHVVFSSSVFLMQTLRQLQPEDFPFSAKIAKINRHYEFRSAS